MKKKVLLTSISTIALCLCLIAGSTFALFTDKTEFNIAVTSGNVEIKSTAQVVALHSAEGPSDTYNGKYLEDEHGNYYSHNDIPADKKFTNGGNAVVDENTGKLVISKITPGDKVDVRINTKNLGDVAFRFRYTVKVDTDNGLATGMVLTTHSGEKFEAVKSFTSEWFDVVKPGNAVPSKDFSLELPVYAGNEYQTEHKGGYDDNGVQYTDDIIKDVTYTVLIEAVQSNAVTTEDKTFVELYPTQSALQLAIDNNGLIEGNNNSFAVEDALVLDGDEKVTIANFDLDGKNIPAVNDNGSITRWSISNVEKYDCYNNIDLTLDNATIVAPDGTSTSAVALYFAGNQVDNVIRLENGSTLVAGASTNNSNYCVDVVSSKLTLYIDNTSSLNRGNNTYAIHAAEGAVLKIVVPDASVKAYYEPLIANESATISWEYAN